MKSTLLILSLMIGCVGVAGACEGVPNCLVMHGSILTMENKFPTPEVLTSTESIKETDEYVWRQTQGKNFSVIIFDGGDLFFKLQQTTDTVTVGNYLEQWTKFKKVYYPIAWTEGRDCLWTGQNGEHWSAESAK